MDSGKVKIMKFLLVLSLVIVQSCSAFRPQRAASEWQALDSATDVSCAKWPMPPKALSIRDIDFIPGAENFFITDYMLRTGASSRERYVNRFSNKTEIEVEDLQLRKFGSESMLVGGGEYDRKPSVALIQKKSSRFIFELRSIEDNIVRYSVPLPYDDIVAGQLHIAGSHLWLRLSRTKGNASVEDARVSLLHLQPALKATGKRSSLVLRTFNSDWDPSMALISLDKPEKLLTIWGEKTGIDNRSFRFFVASADSSSGTVDGRREIEITTDANVESWSVVPFKGGFLLAIVDGDSLVGQSKLKIARLLWEGEYHRVGWLKTRSLDNEHVSEPEWLMRGDQAVLLLPKWVDGESTIAAYTVSAGDVENSQAIGVFPNGVRVMESFLSKKDNYALIRYRKSNHVQYELCNLGEF
jgi:hypothetical protein